MQHLQMVQSIGNNTLARSISHLIMAHMPIILATTPLIGTNLTAAAQELFPFRHGAGKSGKNS
jgi:hypothetical protein